MANYRYLSRAKLSAQGINIFDVENLSLDERSVGKLAKISVLIIRDPFDRMLSIIGLSNALTLVTVDSQIA